MRANAVCADAADGPRYRIQFAERSVGTDSGGDGPSRSGGGPAWAWASRASSRRSRSVCRPRRATLPWQRPANPRAHRSIRTLRSSNGVAHNISRTRSFIRCRTIWSDFSGPAASLSPTASHRPIGAAFGGIRSCAGRSSLRLFAKLLFLPPDERYSVADLTPPASARRRFARSANGCARTLASGRFLLVVEDLHWIDASTLEFLGHFIGEGPHERILTRAHLPPRIQNSVAGAGPSNDPGAQSADAAASGRVDAKRCGRSVAGVVGRANLSPHQRGAAAGRRVYPHGA